LITEVKDTGKGIENDRVKYLFKTFGELSNKHCMKKVVDYGIGVGLCCSKELSQAINGDVLLISSKKGQTIFRVKTPLNALSLVKKKNLNV
jgi:K+-sensing histidine kinase KdpD